MPTARSSPALAPASPPASRVVSRAAWARLARLASWPTVAALAGLNAWWWWDARPLPNLRMVERWVVVKKEAASRPVPWWDVWDVPRDIDGALAVLRRAVRRSPHDADARVLLGRALVAKKDFRGCAEQLRQVPFWSPLKPEALYFEAMSWLELKRVRDAEAALVGYLATDPNHPWPRPERVSAENKLLDIYAWEDRWEESRALVWKAYDDAKDSPLARQKLLETCLRTRLERSNPAATLINLRELLAADPDDWEARRALAVAANHEGRFAEADSAIRRCLDERPKDPRAWADWLEMLESRNDFAAISAALRQVPAEALADGRAWMVKGRSLRQAKDFRAAAGAFAKAVELLPYEPSARHLLAQCLQMTGRGAEAEPHRRRHAELLEISKELPDAVNAFKDATEAKAPDRDAVKAAMLRLSAACRGMGWTRDAEGWAGLANDS